MKVMGQSVREAPQHGCAGDNRTTNSVSAVPTQQPGWLTWRAGQTARHPSASDTTQSCRRPALAASLTGMWAPPLQGSEVGRQARTQGCLRVRGRQRCWDPRRRENTGRAAQPPNRRIPAWKPLSRRSATSVVYWRELNRKPGRTSTPPPPPLLWPPPLPARVSVRAWAGACRRCLPPIGLLFPLEAPILARWAAGVAAEPASCGMAADTRVFQAALQARGSLSV
jgi:hypothetical protein